jgi:hypothetical protein
MKGVIERIDHKELGDGREYLSFQISGNKYSVWDKKYFGQFTEGMPVDFKFKKSGKYLNISEIEEDPNYKPGNNGNGNNNPFNYPNQRDLQILKTSCLKCATYLVNGVPLDVDKKVDLALDVAKRLEKYLTIVPDEPQNAPTEDSPEQGRFEGEF